MNNHQRILLKPVVGLIFLILVILAAGAYYDWGKAALILLTGIWLILTPPQHTPHRFVNIGALVLLGWGGLQLVPGWGIDGGWRSGVIESGVQIASSIAPQRQLQLECLLLVFTGVALLFLYTDLNRRVSRRERRVLLTSFAIVMGVLVMVCFGLTRVGIHNPLAPTVHLFSFMPNRNQMSVLGALGGLIAFALSFERIVRHPVQGVLLMFICALNLVGVSSLHSRAGVILLILGCVGWVVVSWHRETLAARFKWMIPFALLLIAVIFLMGDVATHRIMGAFEGGDVVDQGIGRPEIWRDALTMGLANGWTGIGFGEFSYVFSHFRDLSNVPARILHPESDVLWAWIELGIPGLVGVGLIFLGLSKAMASGDHGVDRFRKIAGMGVVILLLHAFVDVSLHRYGTYLAGVWLCGMAMWMDPANDRALWLRPWLWRVMGMGMMITGFWLGVSVLKREPVMSQTVSKEATDAFSIEYKKVGIHSLEDRWLETAMARFPLVWSIYSSMGYKELREGKLVEAHDSFKKARAVETKMGVIALAEGDAWASVLPAYAIFAYKSAFFDRKIDAVENPFRRIYAESQKNPPLNQGLARLSRGNLEMRRVVLIDFGGEASKRELQREFKESPELSEWSMKDQERLYLQYGRAFGWSAALRTLEEAKGSQPHPILNAYLLGQTGQIEVAVKQLEEETEGEVESSYAIGAKIPDLVGRMRRNPEDLASLMALVRECRAAGDLERAVEAMEDYRGEGRITREYRYWYARLLTDLGGTRKAWGAWRGYLEGLKKRDEAWDLDKARGP